MDTRINKGWTLLSAIGMAVFLAMAFLLGRGLPSETATAEIAAAAREQIQEHYAAEISARDAEIARIRQELTATDARAKALAAVIKQKEEEIRHVAKPTSSGEIRSRFRRLGYDPVAACDGAGG
ncbi:MAG: hypothetical protein PHV00_06170 [Syntrophales bacterium]|jgi:demethoxyubiquinone hydroxylase (CLK1/Coq7/Cat5 family)|nr:hypothetical protein [Dehalococcoidia bacterium]MDD4339249.1 hypothetical protein [Syntrophales bacterium]